MEAGDQFLPRTLYLLVMSAGTHWVGGWVSVSAGLEAVEKRKISFLYPKSNPDFLAVQPVVCPETYSSSYHTQSIDREISV
jgi:hypothetical protein